MRQRLLIPLIIRRPQNSIQSLEGHGGLFLSQFHGSHHHHGLARTIGKAQLHLSLDGRGSHMFGIVDKGLAGFITRGEGASDGEFECLNDGGFATAIGTDDDGEGEAECDDLFFIFG
mmetsp:Transcript_14580/g.27415  ORF Transcript_14580/g.27415 Transcript_14580/m.27415 type:complete len:117 (-) Transcript_14580:1833-2183(-)